MFLLENIKELQRLCKVQRQSLGILGRKSEKSVYVGCVGKGTLSVRRNQVPGEWVGCFCHGNLGTDFKKEAIAKGTMYHGSRSVCGQSYISLGGELWGNTEKHLFQ